MSQMYVAVDLGKIQQCGSAENKTAKLVEDFASEYSVELQVLKNLEYFELKHPTQYYCLLRHVLTTSSTE